MKQPEERTAEEKMALLGKPKLGEVFRAQIRIKESKEFKNTVDKLVQRANASILLGESILFFLFFLFDLKNSLQTFLRATKKKKFEQFPSLFQFFTYFFFFFLFDFATCELFSRRRFPISSSFIYLCLCVILEINLTRSAYFERDKFYKVEHSRTCPTAPTLFPSNSLLLPRSPSILSSHPRSSSSLIFHLHYPPLQILLIVPLECKFAREQALIKTGQAEKLLSRPTGETKQTESRLRLRLMKNN